MKKGFFIVIEGIDGSGKTTQQQLLENKLKSLKKKILTVDFPRYYDSKWGEMVGEFLTGKYGKFKQIDPHLSVLLYMLDQYTWSRDIARPWIEKGGIILSNRYFTSNVHQIAKLRGVKKKNYRDWLWSAGYNELKILKPDLVIFIDVSDKMSKKLNLKKSTRGYLKGKKQDEAEKDRLHQRKSYDEYVYTVKNNSYWKRVKAETKNNIDTPEVIHDRIWKIVEKYI